MIIPATPVNIGTQILLAHHRVLQEEQNKEKRKRENKEKNERPAPETF